MLLLAMLLVTPKLSVSGDKQLFGGDMMLSQEQIRETFGPELADIAPTIFKLREPGSLDLMHIRQEEQRNAAIADAAHGEREGTSATDSTSRHLGAPVENNRLWKYGRVFFHLDAASLGADQVNLLRTNLAVVAQRLRDLSGITLIEKEIPGVSVRIFDDNGCWSDIGAQSNPEMSLTGGGCAAVGLASHEFLHLLNMFHMQSVSDRDDWVSINWDFITPGREHNFASAWNSHSLNVKYDFESIMHYRQFTFTQKDASGQFLGPSIEVLDPTLKAKYQDTMGNFVEISTRDAVKLQLM
jgi:hypothetical protein